MSSLLASLYSRIRGSQEDVATFSLTYILESSDKARKRFVAFLTNKIGLPYREDYHFINQATGSERERPDIAVIADGKEEALIEAKFYAGLTQNQPATYLNRVIQNKGRGLIFICPTARKPVLFKELLKRVTDFTVKLIDSDNYSIKINGITLCVVDWLTVIWQIEDACSNNTTELSDVLQLKGLCKRMDAEEPLPFTPQELENNRSKELIKLFSLPNNILSKLKLNDNLQIDTTGLRTTPRDGGLSRYFRMKGWGCDLTIDFNQWNKIQITSTPLWLTIKEIGTDGWRRTSTEIANKLMRINSDNETIVFFDEEAIWVALEIPMFIEFEEVINLLVQQVNRVALLLPIFNS